VAVGPPNEGGTGVGVRLCGNPIIHRVTHDWLLIRGQ
jgi:hypothetical protein